MDREQLLNRLMARCSRAEYSTGQVAAYARRWLDREVAQECGAKGVAAAGSQVEETVGARAATAEHQVEEAVVGKQEAQTGQMEQEVHNGRERIVAGIVEQLVREKFVDDRRFAAAFVRDKLRFNGWGRQKIVYKLRLLGVEQSIISEAIDQNYYGGQGAGTVSEVLEKLVSNKWNSLCRRDERKLGSGGNAEQEYKVIQARRAAVLRFATSRGFEYEEILKCLNNIV